MKIFVISAAAIFAALSVGPAKAAIGINGKAVTINSSGEWGYTDEGFQNILRVEIIGECVDTEPVDNPTRPKTVPYHSSIQLNSGRMDGVFAHNAANYAAAVSLLTEALEHGYQLSISGPTLNCGPNWQTAPLWKTGISINKQQ